MSRKLKKASANTKKLLPRLFYQDGGDYSRVNLVDGVRVLDQDSKEKDWYRRDLMSKGWDKRFANEMLKNQQYLSDAATPAHDHWLNSEFGHFYNKDWRLNQLDNITEYLGRPSDYDVEDAYDKRRMKKGYFDNTLGVSFAGDNWMMDEHGEMRFDDYDEDQMYNRIYYGQDIKKPGLFERIGNFLKGRTVRDASTMPEEKFDATAFHEIGHGMTNNQFGISPYAANLLERSKTLEDRSDVSFKEWKEMQGLGKRGFGKWASDQLKHAGILKGDSRKEAYRDWKNTRTGDYLTDPAEVYVRYKASQRALKDAGIFDHTTGEEWTDDHYNKLQEWMKTDEFKNLDSDVIEFFGSDEYSPSSNEYNKRINQKDLTEIMNNVAFNTNPGEISDDIEGGMAFAQRGGGFKTRFMRNKQTPSTNAFGGMKAILNRDDLIKQYNFRNNLYRTVNINDKVLKNDLLRHEAYKWGFDPEDHVSFASYLSTTPTGGGGRRTGYESILGTNKDLVYYGNYPRITAERYTTGLPINSYTGKTRVFTDDIVNLSNQQLHDRISLLDKSYSYDRDLGIFKLNRGTMSNIDDIPHGSIVNTNSLSIPDLTQVTSILGDMYKPVRPLDNIIRTDDLFNRSRYNRFLQFEKDGGSLPKAQWGTFTDYLGSAYDATKEIVNPIVKKVATRAATPVIGSTVATGLGLFGSAYGLLDANLSLSEDLKNNPNIDKSDAEIDSDVSTMYDGIYAPTSRGGSFFSSMKQRGGPTGGVKKFKISTKKIDIPRVNINQVDKLLKRGNFTKGEQLVARNVLDTNPNLIKSDGTVDVWKWEEAVNNEIGKINWKDYSELSYRDQSNQSYFSNDQPLFIPKLIRSDFISPASGMDLGLYGYDRMFPDLFSRGTNWTGLKLNQPGITPKIFGASMPAIGKGYMKPAHEGLGISSDLNINTGGLIESPYGWMRGFEHKDFPNVFHLMEIQTDLRGAPIRSRLLNEKGKTKSAEEYTNAKMTSFGRIENEKKLLNKERVELNELMSILDDYKSDHRMLFSNVLPKLEKFQPNNIYESGVGNPNMPLPNISYIQIKSPDDLEKMIESYKSSINQRERFVQNSVDNELLFHIDSPIQASRIYMNPSFRLHNDGLTFLQKHGYDQIAIPTDKTIINLQNWSDGNVQQSVLDAYGRLRGNKQLSLVEKDGPFNTGEGFFLPSFYKKWYNPIEQIGNYEYNLYDFNPQLYPPFKEYGGQTENYGLDLTPDYIKEYKTGGSTYKMKSAKRQEGGENSWENNYSIYENFIQEQETSWDYVKNKNSAVLKPDGKTYYKIFEDGKFYPYYHENSDGTFETKATIGFGRRGENIYDNYKDGLSLEDAQEYRREDIDNSLRKTKIYVDANFGEGAYDKLTDNEKFMLTDYTYNLGKLSKYPKYANAIVTGDYETALKEYIRNDQVGGSPLARNDAYLELYLQPWVDLQIQKQKEEEERRLKELELMKSMQDRITIPADNTLIGNNSFGGW